VVSTFAGAFGGALRELDPLEGAWNWEEGEKHSFLFLAKPRLFFTPQSIKKGSKRVRDG